MCSYIVEKAWYPLRPHPGYAIGLGHERCGGDANDSHPTRAMSYRESARDFNRRAALYVDNILRGTKQADLPIQHRHALGLTIPLELLVLSDEIIE
jgi:hypothetical protein